MSKNIVRVNKNMNYTTMSNYHLKDEKLSWKAKGIHSYILSLPDDWKVVIEHLRKVSRDGRDSTRSGIQELYDLYYWQRYPVYVDGIISQWVTEIYEEPFDEKDKIKNIIYRDNKKIITYENKEDEEIDLDTGNPLVVDNTDVELLTGNQQVGIQQVENPELPNTNNTKDLSITNHSINQEEKIDRYDRILKNIEFEHIKRRYKDYYKTVDLAIKKLCFDDANLKHDGIDLPREIILNDIKDLNYFHIEWSILKIKEISSTEKIDNFSSYMSKIIYTSLHEKDIDIKSDIERNIG